MLLEVSDSTTFTLMPSKSRLTPSRPGEKKTNVAAWRSLRIDRTIGSDGKQECGVWGQRRTAGRLDCWIDGLSLAYVAEYGKERSKPLEDDGKNNPWGADELEEVSGDQMTLDCTFLRRTAEGLFMLKATIARRQDILCFSRGFARLAHGTGWWNQMNGEVCVYLDSYE